MFTGKTNTHQTTILGLGAALIVAAVIGLTTAPQASADSHRLRGQVLRGTTHQGAMPVNDGFGFRPIVMYAGSPGMEFCPADITGPEGLGSPDGNVDALDFLALIAQWGSPCVGSCEADITGPSPLVPDGNVDALDYLLLIAQWGSPGNCP